MDPVIEFQLLAQTAENRRRYIVGTSGHGKVLASLAQLRAALGNESSSKTVKARVEWWLLFPDGEVATIYDYQQHHIPLEDLCRFEIGGSSPDVVARVGRITGRWAEASLPPEEASAADAYRRAREETEALLGLLRNWLLGHQRKHDLDPDSWALVGDINLLNGELREFLDGVLGVS